MNEHTTEEALRRVMSSQAEPDAKLAILRHFASCEECAAIGRRVAAQDLQALTSTLADADVRPLAHPLAHPPAHPNDESELRPYAAGRLGAAESEIVSSHLDDCERCRARLQAIQARPRRAWIYSIAASIVIVISLSLAVTMTRRAARPLPVAVRPQPAKLPPLTTTMPAREIDPKWQQLVAQAVEKRSLPFPAVLATLSVPADGSRGSDAEAERVSPAGVILEAARPRFSWPAANGATYVVFVFDGEREVARSLALRRAEWTPSSDLPRGRTLAWQVEIRRADETSILPFPPAPPALFRVITHDEEREIARAKELHSDDSLLLAVLYARSGLRDAALEHLRLAAKKGNADAEQILSSLDDQ